MKRRLLSTTIAVLFLLSAVSVYAAQKKPYKVGCVFAITGGASWLGGPERNTAEMIAKQINEAGGINGHKLELYIEDTQGDNTRAVNAVKKLIKKDHVCAIIGPSRSGTSMAVIPIVQQAKIPMVSCAAAESIISPVSERKWVFKTAQNDSDAVRRIYEDMNKKGISKVGIITGTTGFGAAGREQLKSLADKYNIKIVADETYNPTDTDMTAQLIRIKNAGAQAVINWSIVPAQSIVPKNMHELKMTIPLYQSHGFGNIKYVEAAGAAANGIIFPGGRLLAADTVPADNPQKDVLMKYKKEYEETYKEPASTFGGHAYDALSVVVKALKKVGNKPAKIRKAIENTNYVGITGVFHFTKTNHSGMDKNAFDMLTVKDGKFVVLKEGSGK